MSVTCVLVVDDDRSHRLSVEKILSREGYQVIGVENGQKALEACRKQRVDVVITDLMMPGMSGIDVIKALSTVAPDVEVIVMTAYGTIETAVESMREGAYDFIEKPLKRMQLVRTVKKAAERRALVAENRVLRSELNALKQRTIVGTSEALRRSLDMAAQAAPTSATVLLLGESGTGKELFARYIHERSGRQGAFVGVNLSALPESVLEGELFGYERGAFTGAIAKREGRIAQANHGTLFLDEVGEISASLQVKLLRVLQEGEYEPLGGRTERADFRLVAATNRDLNAAIAEGKFREDLYYRLNVIAIVCPPLSARREDISLLVDHFIEVYCTKNNKAPLQVSDAARQALFSYNWPGNVRELENAIERAVVLNRTATLDVDDLPPAIAGVTAAQETLTFPMGTPLDEIERRVIEATLARAGGDKQLAAQLLGISTRTIYRRLDPSAHDLGQD